MYIGLQAKYVISVQFKKKKKDKFQIFVEICPVAVMLFHANITEQHS